MQNWYQIRNEALIDTPSLLVYPERVKANIERMIEIAGDVHRLRPHVKTHKSGHVAQLHLPYGIHKFKCATIAEAEMLVRAGAKEILLAHQPVGPKLHRLLDLTRGYPHVKFASICDDADFARHMSEVCEQSLLDLEVWLDLDNGMKRSGIAPGPEALALVKLLLELPRLTFGGIHAYDGHLRDSDFSKRKEESDKAFQNVLELKAELENQRISVPTIVAGGSPTFNVHALREGVELSPGTYVYWDAGYGKQVPDLPFEPAALVATRVISKPGNNRLCLDLGHKSIASESPIEKRVRLLGLEDASFAGHSEEHLIIDTPKADDYRVGDLIYGLPWHICPTVALHQQALVIEDHQWVDAWPTSARNRKLTF